MVFFDERKIFKPVWRLDIVAVTIIDDYLIMAWYPTVDGDEDVRKKSVNRIQRVLIVDGRA